MSFHDKTANVSKGKWKGILLELGLPESALKDRHGPCPLCNSQNNFRWDNREGSGSYICTCGAGDGMKLAIAFTGKPFPEVAAMIDRMVGNIKPGDAPKPDLTEEDRRQILRQTYAATKAIVPGDLADAYLTSRGIGEIIYPAALRFGAALRDGEGGVRPAMVAMVGMHGQPKFVSMHRTFLRPDGLAKAEMAAPRKLMPGHLADGACVMLTEYTGGALGIAEGIETAMSASALYDLPVWAAINSTMLAKWIPPEGCEEVAVFGDNDAKFGGQAAAHALAHRLACKGLSVSVHIPTDIGTDWNDALMGRKGMK